MVVIYPLSDGEDRTIRWVARIAATLAVAITLLLGTISITLAAG